MKYWLQGHRKKGVGGTVDFRCCYLKFVWLILSHFAKEVTSLYAIYEWTIYFVRRWLIKRHTENELQRTEKNLMIAASQQNMPLAGKE